MRRPQSFALLPSHHLWLVLQGAALLACYDASEPEPVAPSPPPLRPTPVRTSSGCQGWRDATCNHVERCGATIERCGEKIALVSCHSEESADRCAAEIDVAACGAVPVACRPAQVALSAAASEGCEQYVQAVCESATTCRVVDSFDACMQRPSIDCDKALGLRADFTACLAALDALQCSGWAPPDVCRGAVLLGP